MRLFLILSLVLLGAGCGDSRTTASLRTLEELQSVTNTFVPGTTTVSDVHSALGLWNRVEKRTIHPDVLFSDESVVYWTAGGGEIWVNFEVTCDAAFPNCRTGGEITNAKSYFTGVTVVED